MATLLVEVSGDGDNWMPAATLGPDDRYGSLSDEDHNGVSNIYVFGVNPVENIGEIKRSTDGMDVEVGANRDIFTSGLESVVDLAPGEHHEMMLKTRKSSAEVLVRFTFSDI